MSFENLLERLNKLDKNEGLLSHLMLGKQVFIRDLNPALQKVLEPLKQGIKQVNMTDSGSGKQTYYILSRTAITDNIKSALKSNNITVVNSVKPDNYDGMVTTIII